VDKNLYAIDVATGNIIWSFNDGALTLAWYSSPAVATVGGQTVIFAGNVNTNVYAIRDNGATPFLLWKFPTGLAVDSSPVVTTIAGTQVVIVGSDDGKLYALVAATGALYPGWAGPGTFFEAGTTKFESSPAILGSTIFIGNDNNKLYAVNLGNGIKLWDFTTIGANLVVSSPAVAHVGSQDMVFFGSDDFRLYALPAASGNPLAPGAWSQPVGARIRSSPAIATIPNPPTACTPGPTLAVIFGSDDGNVYAMRASDGTPCWTFPSTGLLPFESSPTVSGQTVYIGSDDHSFYAIDINTGTWQWSFPALDIVGFNVPPNAVVSGSTVYFGSEDKRLYAFEGVPLVTTTQTSTESTSTTTTIPVTQTSTVTTATATVSSGTTTQMQTTTQTLTSTVIASTVSMAPPGPVPGFPIESILVGLLGGLVVLTLLGRRHRRQSSPA
jgi:outer membrane protein assembly factor BamB